MTTAVRKIAFVDPSITDLETLLASLDGELEVVVLDRSSDGLLQIADILRGYTDLSAIHVFSHGGIGEIMLGDSLLNTGNLVYYSDPLLTIGNALTESGDILLYGCNVAAGDEGQAFIETLARMTGADVAASTDLTGNAALGGNWVLESSAGAVDTNPLTPTDVSVTLSIDYRDLSNGKVWSFMADAAAAAYAASTETRTFLLESSWEPIELAGGLSSGSFDQAKVLYQNGSSSAFVARSGNTAVISFSGTDDGGDWRDNAVGMQSQIIRLLPLIDAFDAFIANNPDITTVYVGGHSLGGALAQAYMMVHPDSGGVGYEAVTFAAPGFNFGNPGVHLLYEQIMAASNSKMANLTDSPVHDNRVIQFEIAGDIVPDLPFSKIGDTIHLTCQGEGIAPIPLHAMALYSQAVRQVDNVVAEGDLPADPNNVRVLLNTTGDAPLTDFNLLRDFDFIVGSDGSDTLGGTGANKLYGGPGNDFYYVEDPADRVEERPDEGIDGVSAKVTYALANNVENLYLDAASGNIDGFGNELNNEIVGNADANVLSGRGGDDRLDGGGGNDTLLGGAGYDLAVFQLAFGPVNVNLATGIATGYGTASLSGIEGIIGSRYDDTLIGDSGPNFFQGLGGADDINGGDGVDSVSYGDFAPLAGLNGVVVDLAFGIQFLGDTLISIEDVWGSDFNDRLSGRSVANYLSGGKGSDELNGRGDADRLHGNESADTFIFDSFAVTDARLGIFDTIIDYDQGDASNHAYSAGEGDIIDLTAAVASLYPSLPAFALADLVRAQKDDTGQFANLSIRDTDGNWLTIARLDGIQAGNTLKLKLDPTNTAATLDITVAGIPPVVTVPSPNWTITPNATTVSEDVGDISFTVTRSSYTTDDTVYLSTTINQGSLNEGDYTPWLDVPVTFAAGDPNPYVATIHIEDDNEAEGPEMFGFVVQSAPHELGGEYDLARATFSIIDDDLANTNRVFTENDDLVWIEPAGGAQSFDGLAGNDTAVLNLIAWTGGISTSTSGNTRTFSSGANSLSFIGVENFFVIAGSGNDTLTTGAGFDGLFGGAGNDVLDGGAGIDILDGGADDDTFNNVGYGDIVVGGSGFDTLNLNRSDLSVPVTLAITSDASGTINDFSLPDGTTVSGIELLHLWTGSGDDHVAFANTTTPGQQTWQAGAGNDTAVLDFSAFGSAISANASGTIYQAYVAGESSPRIYLSDVENVTVYGGAGNDTLSVQSGTNALFGNDGDDTLTGGTGSDTLNGGAGNDTIWVNSGGGVDTIDGGSGFDTLHLYRPDLAVPVTLAITANATGTLNDFSLPDGTTVSGIEQLELTTGNSDDHLTFTNLAAAGRQYWNGGGGNDTAVMDFSTLGSDLSASVSFGTCSAQVAGEANPRLYLTGIENVTITGGAGNDTLSVQSGTNALFGNDGDDTLTGGTGSDTLNGGAGNDTIWVNSGGGVDTIDGGSGFDTLHLYRPDLAVPVTLAITANATGTLNDFSLPDGTTVSGIEQLELTTGNSDDHLTFTNLAAAGRQYWNGGGGNDTAVMDFSTLGSDLSASVSFGTCSAQVAGEANPRLYLTGIENVTITGGAGNDTLSVQSGTNALFGNDGDDTLTGGTGSDTLNGGTGNDTIWVNSDGGVDTIDGGSGFDTLHLYRPDLAVPVTLAITANATGTLNDFSLPDGTTVSGIEQLELTTGNSDDHLTFTNLAAAGRQYWNGGGGNDTAVMDFSTLGSDLSASVSFGTCSAQVAGEANPRLYLTGIENVTITGGAGNDTLSVQSGTNALFGNDGDDTLTGGTGSDTLNGGAGNDTIWVNSGGGVDTIDGGSGFDTLHLYRPDLAVPVTLAITANATGTLNDFSLPDGTTVSGIEQLELTTGNSDDHLTFTNLAAAGRQYWNGGGGNDTAVMDFSTLGSDLSASVSFGTCSAQVAGEANPRLYLTGIENVTITGGAGNDTLSVQSGTNALFGNDGDDTLTGGTGSDTLNGGAGNDTIWVNSGGGVDTIDGGSGFDTLHLYRPDLAVPVTLAITANATGTLNDFSLPDGTTVSGIEQLELTTGNSDDHLTFTNLAAAGRQYWNGGGGNDTAVMDFSTLGSDLSASVSFGTCSAQVAGEANPRLYLTGIENVTITGGAGNDTLSVQSGTNALFGNDGDDTLTGGSGADVINGGLGLDTISLGAGLDQVVGSLAELDGDRIHGFELGETILVEGATVLSALTTRDGSDTLLLLDEDGDGTAEATVRLVGFTAATSFAASYANGNTALIASNNLAPTALPINAGNVLENGGLVGIDLLADSGATDSDGGTLGVANVTVLDSAGQPVLFTLAAALLSIDPAQFAAALGTGDSTLLSIAYQVTDGQGGVTPNSGTLVVDGLDGPFTWYADGDADGFGVDDVATNQSAYAAPANTAGVAGDADDADGTVYPGAPEINDGKDNDQDGATDEDNSDPVADAETVQVARDAFIAIPVAVLLTGDTDADGDVLTVTGVSAAVNGTVLLDNKGDADPTNDEVIFTPTPGFSGAASFDYTVSDGFGGSARATVTVTVAAPLNLAPTGSATAVLVSGSEDTAYVVSTVSLLAGFSDADGDALAVDNLAADHGSVADNGDGTWTVTPVADYNGPVSLSYNVVDGNGGSISASQSFSLAAVNDAPTGTATAVLASGTEDIAYVVSTADLLLGFSDADGDALAVANLAANHGSVTDNGDGTWTITPVADYNGPVSLSYNVVNGNGGSISASQSFSLAAVNDAPTGTATAVLASGTEDIAYVVSTADLLLGFSDADGDALAVANLAANHGSVTDNGDGTWTITPVADYNGPVSLSYNVVNGNGGTIAATQSFSLAAVNDAPTGTATAVLASGTEDTAYVVSTADLLLGFSDADGDALAVANLAANHGSVTDNGDGTWTVTPAVNYNGAVALSYNVIDGNGGSIVASQSFSLAALNDAPTGTATAVLPNGTEDTAYVVSTADLLLGFSDADGDALAVDNLAANHGTVTDNGDGTWTITPVANYNGPVSLGYNVIDGNGGSIAASQSFNLSAVNDAPTLAQAIADQNTTQGASFAYVVPLSTFTDVDAGDTLTYAAALADGSALPTWLSFDAPTHSFSGTPGAGDIGSLNIRVTATDGASASVSDVFTLAIGNTNDAPTGTATAVLASGTEDTAYLVSTADLLAGFSDADGDTLDVTNLAADHGSVAGNGNGTWTVTPVANFNGPVSLSYNVIDGNGGSIVASQSFSLAAVNDAPTGTATAALASGTEDTAYLVSAASLLAGFSDADGDTLSVSGLSANHGSVANNGDGTWTITPVANYNGAVSLSYNVVDGNGGSIAASQSFSLAAVNDAPTGTATAVLASGTEDTTYVVSTADLLLGFSDVDGDALAVDNLSANHGSVANNGNGTWTVTPELNYNGAVALSYDVVDGNGGSIAATQNFSLTAVNDAPIGTATAVLPNGTEDTAYVVSTADLLLGFSDADGDALAVDNLSSNHGAVSDNGNGTWTITPELNYNGAVALSYDVIDGKGGSIAASQSFSLAAVNDAPIGTAAAVLPNGTEDTAYLVSTADLLLGFSDADGDTLSVSGLAANHGSVADNGNGTWTVTPAANYNGPVSLGYHVIDGNGGSIAASQSFSLAVVNHAPTGTATAVLAAGAEDTAYLVSTANLLAGFSDADGDTLSVSGLSANHGSVANNGNGTWTITPVANYNGPVSLSYNVVDGNGGSIAASQSFSLAAVNDAPTLAQAIADQNTTQGASFAYVVPLSTFADVDAGDTLTYAAALADGSALPSWLSFDAPTHSFSGTPGASDIGSLDIRVTATDGASASVSDVFTLAIGNTNDAPTGVATAVLASGTEDTAYVVSTANLLAGFTDLDGDALAVDNLSANHGSVTDNGNGTWTVAPTADYNGPVALSYNVIDGNGGSIAATQSFSLSAVNDAPIGTAAAVLPNGTEDTAYLVSTADLLLGFSDADGDTLSVSGLSANHGSVADNGNGTWTVTPAANYNGPVSLGYNVIDGNGGSIAATQIFSLAAVNDAPSGTATAVLAAGAEDTAYLVSTANLLAGFSDADGDTLSVSGLSANHGSVANNGNGTWTITPVANYNGPVSLSYNVVDGNGGSVAATQSFNLAAVNDAPTGTATAVLASGTEDTAYVVSTANLLVGFSDADGDTLSVSGLGANHGSVADNGNGTWTVTPTANYNGPVSLGYNVIDGNGGSIAASQSFSLAAVNDAPVADAETVQVARDGFIAIPVAVLLAGDTDADGDVLTVTGVSGAVNGTVLLDNKGDADPTNDEVIFTPTPGFSGAAAFDYTVSDGFGGSDSATVSVGVINRISGNTGLDYLVGTDGPDAIRSLAGSYDRMAGGGGADQFIFGAEALNGIRERDVILDYEVGVDSIVLENGASVGSIRQTSNSVVIFLEGDGDAIYVLGEGVTASNLTIVGVPQFDFFG